MLQCFLRSTVTRTRQSEREVRACPCLLSCLISFSLRLRDVQLVHDVCRQVEGNGHRIPKVRVGALLALSDHLLQVIHLFPLHAQLRDCLQVLQILLLIKVKALLPKELPHHVQEDHWLSKKHFSFDLDVVRHSPLLDDKVPKLVAVKLFVLVVKRRTIPGLFHEGAEGVHGRFIEVFGVRGHSRHKRSFDCARGISGAQSVCPPQAQSRHSAVQKPRGWNRRENQTEDTEPRRQTKHGVVAATTVGNVRP
mmetsp:Transcript_10619/g.25217  ORF Transcript_10619/g.25217 Transcript_10619/m.25217 type:complete len:251 (+) Transcript_10619:445-1197(+)